MRISDWSSDVCSSDLSSLDQCVEPEIAPNRFIVEERISKTINLNKTCQMLANDVGIGDRLMPVIQGANANDYLRCFDALEGMIGDERIIGVGSMCRRAVGGDDGIGSKIGRASCRESVGQYG